MNELTTLNPLFPGHKPTNVMIDSRSPEKFRRIKANIDSNTFKFDIFNTLPLLQMRVPTSISSWIPSIHLIHNIILFATADQLTIQKNLLIVDKDDKGKPFKTDHQQKIGDEQSLDHKRVDTFLLDLPDFLEIHISPKQTCFLNHVVDF